uniref:Protein kinase domain-containing protein n=1 Tax=Acrobeloides nanus TaxID=290746 RepID=A0A914EAZ9_9BILA
MTITMDDRIKGVAMSYFYPAKFWTIPLRFNIFCEKGNAQLNLTIVASLGPGTYINLYSGGEIKETLNQSFYRNVSRLLEGTMVSVELNSIAWNTVASIPNSSLFVRFEGVNIKSISQPKKSIVWIILLVSAIFIVIIIVIMLGAVYHMKRKKRYFEQLYDMLREMNLPPEEMEKLRRKTDQFRIENNKLHINFNSQLGQGSFSHVYKGHLIGPAPLHLITKSIETQRFCDCEVAVKVGANFGQNEVEQLFKEIEAMKTIGYHENIMGMLGWAMLDEKPCLVFDVAKMDLLKFVKEFRGKSIEGLPMMIKNFLSVLWQVAKGMQYISSKKMIHRDLAARNILLCESYTAKISDFGLCCTCDESSLAYQAVGRSKKLPIKWLSIEALVDRIFSEKSDVWSFGVLMYEMFSLGKVPYATMNNDDVLEFLQENDKRLECPENTPANAYDIMRMCWKKEPDERPCFGELVDLLYGMLETLSDEYAVAC